jgi:LAS superfamily LD-carboxypeptidase LdcB
MRFPVLLTISAMALAACASDDGSDDTENEDFEEAPVESSEAAVISKADCTKKTMTAYDQGKAYKIEVVKIATKRVSVPTGHAFLKMQKAANEAGVSLTLSSGFRTMDEQEYFYNCYKTKSCNNGNLAAKPGYSNHQNGRALDLSTSKWLANNADKFGFKRTVPSEAWHYEFFGKDPGGPCGEAKPKGDETKPKGDAGADAATSE